ncbi:MAG: hypothetical protein ACR2MO_00335 [Acidimicrobiales bacterium]
MVERAPDGMRRFTMRRDFDVSGVSGTGIVLEGVHFSTGVVVIHWLTPPPRGSISVFDDLEQFLSIHVRPHPDNCTVLRWEDGEELVCQATSDSVDVTTPGQAADDTSPVGARTG